MPPKKRIPEGTPPPRDRKRRPGEGDRKRRPGEGDRKRRPGEGDRKRRPGDGKRTRRGAAAGAAGPFARVYAIVRAIPPGRVMTYGQISERLDRRISAAAVGWALSGCPDDVPWHRVVNAKGGFSTDRRADVFPGAQLRLLELEGVTASPDGTIDLDRYRAGPGKRYRAGPGKRDRAGSRKRVNTR